MLELMLKFLNTHSNIGNDGIHWHDCDRTPSWYSNRRLYQVKHKHADLMEEYLKDGKHNPWTRWDSINPDIWLDLKGHPTLQSQNEIHSTRQT